MAESKSAAVNCQLQVTCSRDVKWCFEGVIVSCFRAFISELCDYINGSNTTHGFSSPLRSPPHSHIMAPIAFGSSSVDHTPFNALKKVAQETLDGFGTRAIHAGSDPDPSTGAVIPAISLSTTYKQHGVGNHKVRTDRYANAEVSSPTDISPLGI